MPASVLLRAVGNTRSSALSPATSGTGNSRDCTAWVRYAAGGSPQRAMKRSGTPLSQDWNPGSPGAQRPVPPAWNASMLASAVISEGREPSIPELFASRSSRRIDSPPKLGGIGPERSLPVRSSDAKLARLPSVGGIGPERSLPVRSSDARLARLPSSRGIGPLSSFHQRARYRNWARSPSSGGIGPERSLPPRSSRPKLARLPSWGGIGPESPLQMMTSDRRLVRLPSSGGIWPASSFSWRYNSSRLARSPSSGGIEPARLLSANRMPTTRPMSSTSTPCHSPRGRSVSQLSLSAQFGPPVARYSCPRTSRSGEGRALHARPVVRGNAVQPFAERVVRRDA